METRVNSTSLSTHFTLRTVISGADTCNGASVSLQMEAVSPVAVNDTE